MDPDFTTIPIPEPSGHKKERAHFPLLLYFVLSFWYFEVILALVTHTPFASHLILAVLTFGTCAGLITYALATLFPGKHTGVIIGTVILFLTVVFFCVQTFCLQFYLNYMTISSLMAGTEGVVKHFAAEMFEMIRRGIGIILLYLIPVVLLLVLYRLRVLDFSRPRAVWYGVTVLAVAVLFLAGHFTARSDETGRSRYASNYRYDTAVKTFGLITGSRLDLQYLLFGNPAASAFIEPDASVDVADVSIATPETDIHIATLPPATQPASTEAPTSGEEVPSESASEAPTEPSTEAPTEPPAPVEYAEHTMGIDFENLANTLPEPAASVSRYVAGRTPSRENAYTGMFAGKNLIFITAEGFAAEAIREDLTPTLYRMATKGIQFTEYYQPAWGGSTNTGEFSNLIGLVPANGVYDMFDSADNQLYFTMGNELQRLGYWSAAYHNHAYDMYHRPQTHPNLGYSRYIGMGNGMEAYVEDTWPRSDYQMVKGSVEDYINEEHFSVYYMTVSGHRHYTFYGNTMSKWHRDKVENLPYSEYTQAYLACQIELDLAMEYLIQRLEEAGKADDTVIVIGSDHWPYGMEDNTDVPGYKNALGELYGFDYDAPWGRDHNRLIIWSGCLEDKEPIVVSQPTYSLDILPTLLNLFGLPFDSRLLVGRDVFSEQEPIIIWGDYSWLTDKALFNSLEGVVHARPGHEAEVTQDYIRRISGYVSNSFAFSRNVLDSDYYRILFGDDVNQ